MKYSQKNQTETTYQRLKGPASVFIVTNNRPGWDPMANLFRHYGFDAKIASDAEELKQNLSDQQKPHLFVVDVQKRRSRDQGPNGFQIATSLKERGPLTDVPILLIDDSFDSSMTDSFFTRSDVTVRRYGEPRIHRHVIKKLLQVNSQDDPQSPAPLH